MDAPDSEQKALALQQTPERRPIGVAQGCSIQPVRAMDHEHAIAQVRSRIPQLRRVAVVPDAFLEGVDLQLLLLLESNRAVKPG